MDDLNRTVILDLKSRLFISGACPNPNLKLKLKPFEMSISIFLHNGSWFSLFFLTFRRDELLDGFDGEESFELVERPGVVLESFEASNCIITLVLVFLLPGWPCAGDKCIDWELTGLNQDDCLSVETTKILGCPQMERWFSIKHLQTGLEVFLIFVVVWVEWITNVSDEIHQEEVVNVILLKIWVGAFDDENEFLVPNFCQPSLECIDPREVRDPHVTGACFEENASTTLILSNHPLSSLQIDCLTNFLQHRSKKEHWANLSEHMRWENVTRGIPGSNIDDLSEPALEMVILFDEVSHGWFPQVSQEFRFEGDFVI